MKTLQIEPRKTWLFNLILVQALLMAAPAAHAFSGYLTAFNTLYGTTGTPLDNCGVCHNNFTTTSGQGGRTNNPYGQAVQGASGANITARIQSVENLFSDSDTTSNVGEINLRFFPGWDCTNYTLAGGNLPANLSSLVDPDNVGCGGGGNQPPISDPNGPYTGTTGQPVAFDGTGSSDPEGGNLSYAWDFGDGVGTGTGPTPNYTYATAGTYPVSLTVTDNGGLSDSANSTATINDPGVNQPPTSDPNGPYTGTTGQPVAFDGTGSSDPEGGTIFV